VVARQYRLGPPPWFALDPDRVEVEMGPRTRAVVVVSPNNPTGSVASAGELVELSELCAARGVALISDEVFAAYPAGRHHAPASVLPAGGALRFALDGLSKLAGMPHLKLGWMAMAGPADLRDPALARLELIADSYLSPATPVMTALPRLLELGRGVRDEIAARVDGNRRRAGQILRGSGAELVPAAGGWTAVLSLPSGSDEEQLAADLAEQHRVLVHPGYYFDFDRGCHLILSLLPRPEELEAGLAALAEIV
jgi:aspartate/methionine/tyrosine aminotransferase